MQLNSKNFRLKYNVIEGIEYDEEDWQDIGEDCRKRDFSLMGLNHGDQIQLNKALSDKQKKIEVEKMLVSPHLQVDFQYLTFRQVAARRENLFNKKVLYQNQLSSLKEKGKRLLACQELDVLLEE